MKQHRSTPSGSVSMFFLALLLLVALQVSLS